MDGLCILLWFVCANLCNTKEIRIYTPDVGKKDAQMTSDVYNYYTKLSTFGMTNISGTSIKFHLKACKDTAILLSTAQDLESPKFYEILFGGVKNTKIFISKYHGYPDKAIYAKNLLKCHEFIPMWVSWAKGRLMAGKGSTINDSKIMDWTDKNNPFDIKGIGIMSCWGADAEWIFDIEDNLLGDGLLCGSYGYKLSNEFNSTAAARSKVASAAECEQTGCCVGMNVNDQGQYTIVSSDDFLHTEKNDSWTWYTTCWAI